MTTKKPKATGPKAKAKAKPKTKPKPKVGALKKTRAKSKAKTKKKTKPANKPNLGGRPTKLNNELKAKAMDYIDSYRAVYEHVIPSVVGLCDVLGVARATLYRWADNEGTGFRDILDRCKEKQEFALLNGGLSGAMNASIAKLVMGKHGYKEQVETEHTGGINDGLTDTERATRAAAILDQARIRRAGSIDGGGADLVAPGGSAE